MSENQEIIFPKTINFHVKKYSEGIFAGYSSVTRDFETKEEYETFMKEAISDHTHGKIVGIIPLEKRIRND